MRPLLDSVRDPAPLAEEIDEAERAILKMMALERRQPAHETDSGIRRALVARLMWERTWCLPSNDDLEPEPVSRPGVAAAVFGALFLGLIGAAVLPKDPERDPGRVRPTELVTGVRLPDPPGTLPP